MIGKQGGEYESDQDTDFDDNPIEIKIAAAFIGNKDTRVSMSFESTIDDDIIRLAMRQKLAAIGYTWETEE